MALVTDYGWMVNFFLFFDDDEYLGKRFEGDWPTQQNEGWKMSGRKCSTGKREKIPSQRHFFLYSILVALFLLFMISLLTIKKSQS
jgi:hypothetical protein